MELRSGSAEMRDVKCRTEGGGGHLRERRALCADRIRGTTQLRLKLAGPVDGKMPDFVDHGTLLRNHQQQQQAQQFERLSHSGAEITRIANLLHYLKLCMRTHGNDRNGPPVGVVCRVLDPLIIETEAEP